VTWTPTGTLITASPNVYYMQAEPMYCPACCLTGNVGYQDDLFGAVRLPDGSLGMEPELALKWELSSDLTYIDIELRKGVEFHPWKSEWGDPEMTAEDVAWTWNMSNVNTNPETIHDTAGDIAGFLEKVTVEGPYKVRFHLHSYNASVPLHYLTGYHEGIPTFSKKVFDAIGEDEMRNTPVGTGPFIVQEWTLQKQIHTVAVTEHYRKVPYVAEVYQLEIPENATRVAMLRTGEAHLAAISMSDWPELLDEGFKLTPEGYWGGGVMSMSGNYWEKTHARTGEPLERTLNPDHPWVGNPDDPESMEKAKKVRWAIALDIDRETQNEVFYMGLGKVAYAADMNNDDPLYQSRWDLRYDPEEAKKLMKEAGYPDGFEVTFYVGPTTEAVERGESLGAVWLEHLNINTTFDRQNYNTFRPSLVERTFSGFFWSGDPLYPATWPKGLLESSLTFPGGYCRAIEIPKFGELYLKWNAEADPDKVVEYLNEYQDYNHEWMLRVPVVNGPTYGIYNPNKIISWEMQPEAKGLPDRGNRFETVKLAP